MAFLQCMFHSTYKARPTTVEWQTDSDREMWTKRLDTEWIRFVLTNGSRPSSLDSLAQAVVGGIRSPVLACYPESPYKECIRLHTSTILWRDLEHYRIVWAWQWHWETIEVKVEWSRGSTDHEKEQGKENSTRRQNPFFSRPSKSGLGSGTHRLGSRT